MSDFLFSEEEQNPAKASQFGDTPWHILVVDDEPSVHDVTRLTLNRLDVFDSFLNENEKKLMGHEMKSDEIEQEMNLKDAIQLYEKKIITHHLKENQGKLRNVASVLGINRKTLYYKMKQYHITKF